MKQNIPCEMIQDLLPLYVDGLTSDESSRQIEAHLRDLRRLPQPVSADERGP